MVIKKSEKKRILTYVNGLLYFYGVMHINDIYEMVKSKITLNIKMDTLRDILDSIFYIEADCDYDFDLSEDYYYNDEVENFEWILSEQKKRKDLKYRPVTEKEAALITSGEYIKIWPDKYYKLYHFLVDEIELTSKDAQFEIFLFQSDIRNNDTLEEGIDEFIKEVNLNKDEAAVFVNYITEMINYTSLWSLKGWSTHEISNDKSIFSLPTSNNRSKSKKDNEEEIPDNVILFPYLKEDNIKYSENPSVDNEPFEETSFNKINDEYQETNNSLNEHQEPSLKEWENLYNNTLEFRKLTPWEYMAEYNFFGVMDPETKTTAYCSIMGALGEHFAIGAYLGAEGFRSLSLLMDFDSEDFSSDLLYIQKCLMLSFENRKELSEKDRSVIKKLDLKFRGASEWPLFRSYEPGFFPWFFNAWECRFMTHILKQSFIVTEKFKRDNHYLGNIENNTMLIRTSREINGKLSWYDSLENAPLYKKDFVSFKLKNEIAVKKMKKDFKRDAGIWEIDAFYSSYPLKENKEERPYFPKIFLIVDKSKGTILTNLTVKKIRSEGTKLVDSFIELITKKGAMPTKILVESEETYYLLLDTCTQLGMIIEKTSKLEEISRIKARINQYE